MTVDGSARADLIADEEQLGLFRVESARPVTVRLVWRDPPPAVKGRARLVKHPVDIELRGVTEPPGSVLYARAKPRGDAR